MIKKLLIILGLIVILFFLLSLAGVIAISDLFGDIITR